MAKTTQTHGYSGKPLFQKLGIKPGMRVSVINAPGDYQAMSGAPAEVVFVKAPESAALVHLFCADRSVLKAHVSGLFEGAPEGQMIWISWPKKSSPLFVDLTEDVLREVILPLGWVDVKVCAADQDWSALMFLRRKG